MWIPSIPSIPEGQLRAHHKSSMNSPLRFLNLDLDFFLDKIKYFPGEDLRQRLPESEFEPWKERDVRKFLECGCKLSRGTPTIGRFVTHHDAAFDYWRELVGDLNRPLQIELVHVDAHADLGLGDSSHAYIMRQLLHRPLEERSQPKRGDLDGLSLGNYVAFAAACRWLKSITYVMHPKLTLDLPRFLFRNSDPQSGCIELRRYPSGTSLCSEGDYEKYECKEPPISFETVAHDEFLNKGDFGGALLCQSPNYTPLSSDKLLSVFADYIDFH